MVFGQKIVILKTNCAGIRHKYGLYIVELFTESLQIKLQNLLNIQYNNYQNNN